MLFFIYIISAIAENQCDRSLGWNWFWEENERRFQTGAAEEQHKDEGVRSRFPEMEGNNPRGDVQRDDMCDLHPVRLPVGGRVQLLPSMEGLIPK